MKLVAEIDFIPIQVVPHPSGGAAPLKQHPVNHPQSEPRGSAPLRGCGTIETCAGPGAVKSYATVPHPSGGAAPLKL